MHVVSIITCFTRNTPDIVVNSAKVNDAGINVAPPRAHGAQKGLIVPHAHWRDLECLVVKRFSLIINASGPTAGLISSQIKYLATRAFSV